MRTQAAFPALAACLCLGCALGGPARVKPPAPGSPAARAAIETCYNLEYGFTCVPPRGFLITSEGPGPGQVMTLVKRSYTSAEEANLTVRVYALHNDKLKSVVKERVISPLKASSGLKRIETQASKIGLRDGLEVRAEREYATGPFYTRVFCFERGENAFILEYTAPASKDAGQDALEAFTNSIAFR